MSGVGVRANRGPLSRVGAEGGAVARQLWKRRGLAMLKTLTPLVGLHAAGSTATHPADRDRPEVTAAGARAPRGAPLTPSSWPDRPVPARATAGSDPSGTPRRAGWSATEAPEPGRNESMGGAGTVRRRTARPAQCAVEQRADSAAWGSGHDGCPKLTETLAVRTSRERSDAPCRPAAAGYAAVTPAHQALEERPEYLLRKRSARGPTRVLASPSRSLPETR